nr:MAG: putative RNA-dependent RNA polymerase [Partitiviridae sp.]
MKIESALEIVGKLDAASKKRLIAYRANLAEDKDGKVFDDRARDYLVSISKDGGKLVTEVNNILDSIAWNQSTFTAEMLDMQVERFAAIHVVNRAWRRKFKSVKQQLLDEVKQFDLQAIQYSSDKDILDALPRLDTHAGFSYILTGCRKKGEYTEGLLERFKSEVAAAKANNSFNKPILLGYRTQSSVPVDPHTGEYAIDYSDTASLKKTRLVSMIDIYQVLAECIYAVPFQSRLGKTDWYMGGKNDFDIRRLIFKARGRMTNWISLDYSKYDQSIPAWLIREAFDIVRAAFKEKGFDNELFSIIREDFIHKVFITANGLVEAHDGVPSGSMFTQIIDSIVNRLMIDTYMKSQGLSRYTMFIMGDDNLIFTSQPINAKDIENYLRKNFGIEMNAEKADQGTHKQDPLFLSRFWTEFGVFRHPRILIAKLIYPERRREYDKFGFGPETVVEAYFESFRMGMDRFLNKAAHDAHVNEVKRNAPAGTFLTGLDRYRKLYLDKEIKSSKHVA